MSVSFDHQPRTRVLFGEGTLDRLGEVARELGFTRTLVVADDGLIATGQVDRVAALLDAAGITSSLFHDFESNPDAHMVERGRAFAAEARIDSMVAIGGGSSLDCAKGINFVLTNGGRMADYRGFGKASRPMVPMIGIPTTAGTGSEAQAYAIIADADTHMKMACGDPKAAFRVAILDPLLTLSQPPLVTAVTGIDAISHAVESYVATRRNWMSDGLARDAWRHLDANFARVIQAPDDVAARAAMLFGANAAGAAVEHSMLGATHACANPLTARYGTTHGIAIGILLPRVVRWNASAVADRYRDLLALGGHDIAGDAGDRLSRRIESLVATAGLPQTLSDAGASRDDIPALAREAAAQWTGTFNPRPFDESAAKEIYERAF